MQVALLLTLDPSLENEIENIWEGTLITLDSASGVRAALQSLDHRPLLLVDTGCFQPLEGEDADTVCLGEEICPGFPLLERPVRRNELLSIAQLFSVGSVSSSPDSDDLLPSPFSEFQRDALHDMKNFFTTLQGNILLLKEEKPDPQVEDMLQAAEQAHQLMESLEWMGEGTFPSKIVDLVQMLTELLPFFHRLRRRETSFTLEAEADNVELLTNPKKLFALLLSLVHAIPDHPETACLKLSGAHQNVTLSCSWPGSDQSPPLPDRVSTWSKTLGFTLERSDHSWTLTN